MPLLSLVFLLVAVMAVRSVLAGCCANPAIQEVIDVCSDDPLLNEGHCCPEDDSTYYDDSVGWYPNTSDDCQDGSWYADSCADLPRCVEGCCYDESGSGMYDDICYGKIQSLCMLQSPDANDWIEGFQADEQYESNPCYDLDFNRKLEECPVISVCTQYANKGNCTSAPESCFYCPDSGPTGGAGFCFDECDGNCLGEPADYFINNVTTGLCEQPAGLATECGEQFCGGPEPSCLCAVPAILTNTTHQYCCNVRSTVFAGQEACSESCFPDCMVNAPLEHSQDLYYPPHEKCICGVAPRMLRIGETLDKGYCCGFSYGINHSFDPCSDIGNLSGHVYDKETGGGIKGASVDVAGFLSATTDGTGYYEFPELFVGNYTVTTVADGYGEHAEDVEIKKYPPSTTLDFYLPPAKDECTDPDNLPDPRFNTSCVRGEASIMLHWEKRCSNIEGFYITRKNPDETETELPWTWEPGYGPDTGLEWNFNNYVYVLGVEYPFGIFNYSATGQTGDPQCEGITTEWACLNESDGNFTLDGGRKALIGCDECNVVQYLKTCAENTGDENSVCVGPNHEDQAQCLKDPGCEGLGNPFGLFATSDACYGLGIGNACYLDYSSTVVDTCNSCSGITSCFAYTSPEACDREIDAIRGDWCWVSTGGPCSYSYFNEELGKGICFEENYTGTDFCSLCDDPLLDCTEQTCRDLGRCYYDDEEDRCVACNPTIECYDFKTKESCAGGQNFEIDHENCHGSATPSNNACGLIYCVWTAEGKCIRDVDDDGEADWGDDNQPPLTRPVNPPSGKIGEGGYLLNLSVDTLFAKTWYCIDEEDTCCPEEQAHRLIPTKPNVYVNLPDGRSGDAKFYFRYYSKKNHPDNNMELIKTMPFYLDTEGPAITITYTVTNSTTAEDKSDIRFKIELSELADCTATLEFHPERELGSNTIFIDTYSDLEDGTPYYSVTCTDGAGNSVTNSTLAEVQRVKLIYEEYPIFVTTADPDVVLKLSTYEESSCTVALIDESGNPGTAEGMWSSDELFHTKSKEDIQAGTYKYKVVCQSATLRDTTILRFTADHLAPVTTPMWGWSSLGLQPIDSGSWGREANITLVCKDPPQGPPEEFGCTGTTYCLTAGEDSCAPNQEGTSPFDPGVVNGENYTLCYTSSDGHNDADNKCIVFRIDTEPPNTPELDDSGPIPGEPEFVVVYGGDRLSVSILAEDGESGIAMYGIALLDEEENYVVTWKGFEVEPDEAEDWLTISVTHDDDEWREDENGDKKRLVVGETYYFHGYAIDWVELESTIGESDGIEIKPLNYTPEYCSNGEQDEEHGERGIDCGGPCPPCGADAVCGNNKVEAGEECDGSQWGAIKNCKDLGFIGGNLACLECQFDTLLCIPEEGSYCGDGEINRGELCDDANWGTIEQCSIFNQFTGGLLSCDTTCSYDTIGCYGGSGSTCGDGVIDGGEQCEGTTWGVIAGCSDFGDFTEGTLFCDADCQLDTTMCTGGIGSYCGNGVIDAGEQCDGDKWGDISGCADFDYFTGGDLVCGPDCMFDTMMCTGGSGNYCGDGVIDAGEQCDGSRFGKIEHCSDLGFETPPPFSINLTCNHCLLDTSACSSERNGSCGDGIVDPGEQCDGLNWAGLYGCTDFGFSGGQLVCKPDCTFDTSRCTSLSGGNCGDGEIDAGEQCDGPDWGSIKACTDLDRFSGGILACGADCRFNSRACFGGLGSRCGDGNIDAGEQCEGMDWGDISGCRDIGEFSGGVLSCSNDCQFDTALCTPLFGGECGDGVIDAGEQCDGSTWGDISGCKDFGFTGGKLSCLETCRFNTRECTGGPGGECGDGVIDAGEVCDGSTFGPVKECLDLGFLGGNLDCTECHFDTTSCEAPWQTCIDDIDCESLYCNPDGFCSIPSCFDGWQNGDETGVDCGGDCKSCEDDLGTCNNGVKDPGEKGVDCGGVCTAGCPPGTLCTSDEDCASLNCVNGVCAEASCSDGILNGGESDVDCGRVCSPDLCERGKNCKSNKDCFSGSCHLGKCGVDEARIDDDDGEDDDGKTSPWLKILFFILLLVLLGAGGYFGYTKYMEAKHPTPPTQPGMKPGLTPARPMPKKRELTPREQRLVSRRRREEKKKERGKLFDAFKEGGEKPAGEKPPSEKPAKPEEKPKPKKADAEELFSAFDSGATGVEKAEKKEEKPKKKPASKPKKKSSKNKNA